VVVAASAYGADMSTVTDVAAQLHGFNGYRTVWLDPLGMLWHSEPDEELEALGWRYVGTYLRPDAETLEIAVGRMVLGRPTRARRPKAVIPGLAPA
jgi:hypothetical protein